MEEGGFRDGGNVFFDFFARDCSGICVGGGIPVDRGRRRVAVVVVREIH